MLNHRAFDAIVTQFPASSTESARVWFGMARPSRSSWNKAPPLTPVMMFARSSTSPLAHPDVFGTRSATVSSCGQSVGSACAPPYPASSPTQPSRRSVCRRIPAQDYL